MRASSSLERRVHHRLGRERASNVEIEDAKQHVIESERRRIAQDIHDGVASQLVSLIATLDPHIPEQQCMIATLEQTLLELKFIVDSLGNNFCSVIDALASLRYRIQPALDRKGIVMDWVMQDDAPELNLLAPDRSIHVLRIAQEALNNVLRHSEADTVQMSCTYDDESQSLELVISDNGQGLNDEHRCGNGLANMKNRAQVLGGSLEISGDKDTGTQIRLIVPIDAEEP